MEEKHMRRNSGFTLVEILIVVIILGILAAIVIPQFTQASNDARVSSVGSDVQTVRSQLELYKLQHGDRTAHADAVTLGTSIWAQLTTKTDSTGAAGGNLGPYLQKAPANPFVPDAAGNPDTTVTAAAADPGAGGWWYDTNLDQFRARGSYTKADGSSVDLTTAF
jgi:general secretion pathway protein G